MARLDKDAKQHQRARAEIDAKLTRGRVGEAVDAWLTLPESERRARIGQLAALSIADIGRCHQVQDQPAMLLWLKRVEAAPELLTSAEATTRWRLLQAALRARQWPRARALFSQLEPALAGAASLAALRAVIEHQGLPPAGTLDGEVPKNTEAEDVRLGYGRARGSAVHPPPGRIEEVERLTLQCFVATPWAGFREVLRGWLVNTSPPVAKEVRRLAAGLSQRELIERHARRSRDALEVARFCAESALLADAPAELEPVIALALRALALHLIGAVESRAVVEAGTTIAGAALRYPGLAPQVEPIVLAALYDIELSDAAERLVTRVGEARPSIPLALKAARILELREQKTGSPPTAPEWLLHAVAQSLREPARFAAYLRRTDAEAEKSSAPALEALMDVVPVALGARIVNELWDAADEELRADLAEECAMLIGQMRESRPVQAGRSALSLRAQIDRFDPMLAAELPDAELERLAKTQLGRQILSAFHEGDAQEGPVSAKYRELARTLAERGAPYRVSMLDAAIANAKSPQAQSEWIARYWQRRPSLLERVEALHDALAFPRTATLLADRLTDGLTPTSVDAAQALDYLFFNRAPEPLRKIVALVLLDAVERDPSSTGNPVVARALRSAKRLAKSAKKAPAKKAPAKKVPAKKAPAKKPSATRQADLFADDPENGK